MYSLFLYKFQGQEGSYSSGQYSEGKRVKSSRSAAAAADTSLNYKISYLKEEKEERERGKEGRKEEGRKGRSYIPDKM